MKETSLWNLQRYYRTHFNQGKTCTNNNGVLLDRLAIANDSFTSISLALQAYGEIGDDGSRFLLGDFTGNLFLLALEKDGDRQVAKFWPAFWSDRCCKLVSNRKSHVPLAELPL